ncbi:MAG: glycosyltransferase [Prochlorococcaceae cyanobacterium]
MTSVPSNTAHHDTRALTFCIPSFGGAKYLLETLESIKKQTVPCCAFVAFGGEPPAAIDKYCNAEEWITLVALNPDPGMVDCWVYAAQRCQTEYIAFIADDNCLEGNYAETMINFLESNCDIDFVFCNQSHLDSKSIVDASKTRKFNNYFGRDLIPEGSIHKSLIKSLIQANSVPLEASVFRYKVWKAYGPFKSRCRGAFDMEYLSRVLLLGARVGHIKLELMNFRWHEDAYCHRAKLDHLLGSIVALSELEVVSDGELRDYFREKRHLLECRRLRYAMPWADRISIAARLIFRGYLFHVLRQSAAWLFRVD